MDKTHNARYSELQDEYLKTRDRKQLDKMYHLCVDIASNYIRKYARERGLPLDIPELSHDSAVYVIEQYLRKPGFKIGRISSYIHYGCIKNLFRDKEREQREVFDAGLLVKEKSVYTAERSLDEGGPVPVEGFKMKALRHEPALIKQGLLFEDSANGKGYEEILV